MRLPRPLDPVEIRVLGCLLEKEQTTPDLYPLTLNALVSAANQKSAREPVMDLGASDVEAALDRLQEDVLVWRTHGARAEKFKHALDRRWELDGARKAVMTVLLLRGPQTPGELRSRTDRMHPFASVEEVDETLRALGEGPEALVVELPRQPGQSQRRWMHLVGGEPDPDLMAELQAAAAPAPSGLAARVDELEARLTEVESQLGRLLENLGEG